MGAISTRLLGTMGRAGTTRSAATKRRASSTASASASGRRGTKAKSESAPATSIPIDDSLLAKAERIRTELCELYPPPLPIPLDHSSPFTFLCAVVLSAQTTDKKVNEVGSTPPSRSRAPPLLSSDRPEC